MSKKIKGNGRHLTYSDRVYIEEGLLQGDSFRSIASKLSKDPSTISKEVRLHSEPQSSTTVTYPKCIYCTNFKKCKYTVFNCCNCDKKSCSYCKTNRQAIVCNEYNPFKCKGTLKPPYVCNGCSQKQVCHETKRYYRAAKAQKAYEKVLSNSRAGINMTPDELKDLNDLISPLILKGQPLSHIFAVHADEIPVTRRTLYNYLDQSVFQARNIDLPRRVRYKRRKRSVKSKHNTSQQAYRHRRTYKDFEIFMDAHPECDVVEMDTVKGSRQAGKCLLTFLFRSCNFMLVILLPRCTQECVIKAINDLTETLGMRLFRKYFPVILTDYAEEKTMPKNSKVCIKHAA
ncbi:MAG: helix-turn-helix domain-containing protein [Lachnospiraceae bacterium]|nr:helix-turn-helix domain-containing protein [Lachnospiraceae bacterium]